MITLIACLDMRDGIGDSEGNLLFNIPKDMKHFKDTTSGNVCVFGRKTAETLPNKKPLPNRRNIILTRDRENSSMAGFETATDIDYILELSKNNDIYVCGGGEIYEMFLPYAQKMILTHVHAFNFNATVFFPDFTHKDWNIESMNKIEEDGENPSFTFSTYLRKK